MNIVVEKITEPLGGGEGPFWDHKSQKLYFVDMVHSEIHRYDPKTKNHTWAKIGDQTSKKKLSVIIPVKNTLDKFIISYGCDIALIKWDGKNNEVSALKVLIEFESTMDGNDREVAINDTKCSPGGVLFIGFMPKKVEESDLTSTGKCCLYAIAGKKPKKLLSDVGISNGMAWSCDERKYFYIDTFVLRIDVFDYDAENVELSNRRVLFDFKKTGTLGYPDGMTIDRDGNLYVASFLGNQVLQIDSITGTLLQSIQIPASRVTCPIFGGPNIDELYVTTFSGETLQDYSLPQDKEESCGCTFKVTGLGVAGLPGTPFDLAEFTSQRNYA